MILWVAAIALFFNRWGKIRMLEPYQPKFHEEEHRPSCPMVELASASGIGHSITGGVSFDFCHRITTSKLELEQRPKNIFLVLNTSSTTSFKTRQSELYHSRYTTNVFQSLNNLKTKQYVKLSLDNSTSFLALKG